MGISKDPIEIPIRTDADKNSRLKAYAAKRLFLKNVRVNMFSKLFDPFDQSRPRTGHEVRVHVVYFIIFDGFDTAPAAPFFNFADSGFAVCRHDRIGIQLDDRFFRYLGPAFLRGSSIFPHGSLQAFHS